MTGLTGPERSFTISLAVRMQYTNVADGRTNTGRQQRPHLRIALRGEKAGIDNTDVKNYRPISKSRSFQICCNT